VQKIHRKQGSDVIAKENMTVDLFKAQEAKYQNKTQTSCADKKTDQNA
jgi:hypothetical protein